MKTLIVTLSLIALVATGADFVIYPQGVATNSCIVNSGCPGSYCGHATYSKTISQGWGWKPDTNNGTVFTATYTNNLNVKVQYIGKEKLDPGCGVGTVQITNPPQSTVYRFTVYYPNRADVPLTTNGCPLLLSGMLP
jgi:hypothetical protein